MFESCLRNNERRNVDNTLRLFLFMPLITKGIKVHLLAQYTKSCRMFSRTNDNHTDVVFRIISRETTYKRKFIRNY